MKIYFTYTVNSLINFLADTRNDFSLASLESAECYVAQVQVCGWVISEVHCSSEI